MSRSRHKARHTKLSHQTTQFFIKTCPYIASNNRASRCLRLVGQTSRMPPCERLYSMPSVLVPASIPTLERVATTTVVKGCAMVFVCMRTQKLEESRPVGSEVHLEPYFGKTVQRFPASKHIARGGAIWGVMGSRMRLMTAFGR